MAVKAIWPIAIVGGPPTIGDLAEVRLRAWLRLAESKARVGEAPISKEIRRVLYSAS